RGLVTSLLLRLALRLQITRAGGVKPASAFARRLRRLRLLGLQVSQVGQTIRAADDFEVEAEVIALTVVEHVEHVAAELFARRAGEPLAPPDGAERVLAPVTLLHRLAQCLP